MASSGYRLLQHQELGLEEMKLSCSACKTSRRSFGAGFTCSVVLLFTSLSLNAIWAYQQLQLPPKTLAEVPTSYGTRLCYRSYSCCNGAKCFPQLNFSEQPRFHSPLTRCIHLATAQLLMKHGNLSSCSQTLGLWHYQMIGPAPEVYLKHNAFPGITLRASIC